MVEVGYNSLDPIDKLYYFLINLIHGFVKKHPELKPKLVLRNHPVVKHPLKMNDESVEYSNPNEQSSLQFLQRIDLLLSGNSNLILESLLSNVPTCYFELSDSLHSDNYGFVKNNLAPKPIFYPDEALEFIVSSVKNNCVISDPIRDHLKYYNGAIGKPWENNVDSYVVDKIKSCLRLQSWRRAFNALG